MHSVDELWFKFKYRHCNYHFKYPDQFPLFRKCLFVTRVMPRFLLPPDGSFFCGSWNDLRRFQWFFFPAPPPTAALLLSFFRSIRRLLCEDGWSLRRGNRKSERCSKLYFFDAAEMTLLSVLDAKITALSQTVITTALRLSLLEKLVISIRLRGFSLFFSLTIHVRSTIIVAANLH